MDHRVMGFDSTPLHLLHHLLDCSSSATATSSPSQGAYLRDAKAMSATPADVREHATAYSFVVDMPGIKSVHINMTVEDNTLVISGEKKKREEEEKEEVKYVRMERRVGKFMRKFALPENADMDGVSAVCRNGVLTMTVLKKPPPKPKTTEVKVA